MQNYVLDINSITFHPFSMYTRKTSTASVDWDVVITKISTEEAKTSQKLKRRTKLGFCFSCSFTPATFLFKFGYALVYLSDQTNDPTGKKILALSRETKREWESEREKIHFIRWLCKQFYFLSVCWLTHAEMHEYYILVCCFARASLACLNLVLPCHPVLLLPTINKQEDVASII